MKAILVLLTCSIPTFAQVGALREEVKTINPDGSVTITRKFDPVPPPTAMDAVRYKAMTAPPPIRAEVHYRAVPEVRYVAAPVYYAAPVYAKTPVAEYRVGLFGLRRIVVHADGTTTRYGPFGVPR